jgi:hypothetical protein
MKFFAIIFSEICAMICTSNIYSSDATIAVDKTIHVDNNGKYIVVSLVNQTQNKITISFFEDKYYGDILIGDLFSMNRYANNEIMTMKLCSTYIMPELTLEVGDRYDYKIYEKDTIAWSVKYDEANKPIRNNIEFKKGNSIIVTYPRFGVDSSGDICSSEVTLE